MNIISIMRYSNGSNIAINVENPYLAVWLFRLICKVCPVVQFYTALSMPLNNGSKARMVLNGEGPMQVVGTGLV